MDIFTLFGKIAIENASANKSIDETNDKAKSLAGSLGSSSSAAKTAGGVITGALSKAGNVVGSALSKVGQATVVVGKAMATGAAVGTAAIAALATSSVKGYAEYEQLVGGVETLLGTRGAKSVEEYAEIVGDSVKNVSAEYEMLQTAQSVTMENAANAYKTAGLSANDYMTTVTSLAAALNQSSASQLESAELADMAIIDMSDNANKMGTSMESIQNAYQGFSKQNYTMLDNLKLGYGGTKTEMQRLIKDAAKLDKSVKQNDMSFSNIVKAIHAVQNEMGITGTTAEEASETISGSVATMKGAWSNLVVGIADDNNDLSEDIANLVESVSVAARNIMPRIKVALGGVGELIKSLTPVVTEGLTVLIEEVAPLIPEVLTSLLPVVVDGAAALITALADNFPTLLQTVVDCAPVVIASLGELFDVVSKSFPQIAQTLIPAISEAISWALSQIGVEIDATEVEGKINSIITGAQETIELLVEKCSEIGSTIGEKFSDLVGILEENGVSIEDVFKGIQKAIELIADPLNAAAGAIGEAINLLVDWATTDGSYLNRSLGEIATSCEALSEFATGAFTALEDLLQGDYASAAEIAKRAFEDLWKAVEEGFGRTDAYVRELIGGLKQYFLEQLSIKFPEIDTTAIDNLLTKVGDAIKWIKEAFTGGSYELSNPGGAVVNSILKVGMSQIKWNADGAVLTKPTIFGKVGNTYLGGGEAGAEAVAPIDVLQGYVSDAVAGQNAALVAALDRIYNATVALNDNMPSYVREAMDGVSLGVNNREFGRLVNAAVKG